MSDYIAPLEDIRFVLYDVFQVHKLWETFPQCSELDSDTANAILEEAGKLCRDVFAPMNREADEVGTHWQADGSVVSPEAFKDAYRLYCEGGWGALGGDPAYGGMGLPKSLLSPVEEMFQGACMSFGLAPMLTAGACLAIQAHAAEALKDKYLEKMYSGEWSGVMCLTEAHAGTDLGLIRTKAVPNEDGSFQLTGSKIFITWGENDFSENIIHLVLAKLPDAPEGSRGISLFLVPKMLTDDAGNIIDGNAVSCGSIEKKMGIKASATCVMNYDGAKGWLVGEPNKGLAAMFTMMNYERLVVGIQGMGAAEASYQSAVSYAKERLQGRSTDPSCKTAPAPILVHADVRRMLMTMKALNEGGRAFYTYVATWLDRAKFSSDTSARQHAVKMVDLLTPVAKAFMTDRALDTAIAGQQVFGGHGFVREWGQEQHVRDIRITQIYEGTNGVQAMDLVGRKTIACKGELLGLFVQELIGFCEEPHVQGDASIQKWAEQLMGDAKTLQELTQCLVDQYASEPDIAGAVAVEYLNALGYIAYGYMWLKMYCAAATRSDNAALCQAKCHTAQYYFCGVYPSVNACISQIRNVLAEGAQVLMSPGDAYF